MQSDSDCPKVDADWTYRIILVKSTTETCFPMVDFWVGHFTRQESSDMRYRNTSMFEETCDLPRPLRTDSTKLSLGGKQVKLSLFRNVVPALLPSTLLRACARTCNVSHGAWESRSTFTASCAHILELHTRRLTPRMRFTVQIP